MSNLLILAPAPIAALVTSRGTPAAALLTPDPKEVWTDIASGTVVTIDIDFGAIVPVDTVFLGFTNSAVGSVWSISGGVASSSAVELKAGGALRVPDSAGQSPAVTHGFWTGAPTSVRFLRISATQAGGAPPLRIGVVMAGTAFVPQFNKEWGSGRRPIDLSSVTPLPSGGFAIVEGARKRGYTWTFGDLTSTEVDALEAIADDRGQSRPILVVEDPAQTTGLRRRIHYGLFERWRQYDRRNLVQTRWELGIEEWV